MTRAIPILILCLVTSACAPTNILVNDRAASQPPPPSMGEPCSPAPISRYTAPALQSAGLQAVTPSAVDGCGRQYKCVTDACELVLSSIYQPMPPGGASLPLAFVCDVRSNDASGTPASLGPRAAAPMTKIAEIRVGPSGSYGVHEAPHADRAWPLAGSHWVRVFAAWGVNASDTPKTATASLKVPKDAEIGQCGWRPWSM